LPFYSDRGNITATQLTYFFDVCSMWCALSDDVLAGIQKRYRDRVPITRKIALINDGARMAAGLEHEQWYYQRCEATTGRRFDHRWIEKPGQSTWLPNALIYASEKLGQRHKVHEALKIAGLTRGEPILRRDVALQIAVSATGANRTELENALDDPETSSTISASTAEFNAFAVTQRPTFVIRSEIEDTAIFSGIYRAEPILAAIDAMIADENAYAQFAATYPPIPK
jgi:predicted DsbA family dithiol-disulfide isomerase